MGKINEYGMEKFGTLDSSDKTLAILGDRWWPQTAKQEGDEISKQFYVTYGKNVTSAQMFSIRIRNGPPSRKGCLVKGQMTRASNK